MPQQDHSFLGNDRFVNLRRIGKGGMGVVYQAFDRVRQVDVAIKTISHLNPRTLLAFKQEFRSLAGIHHPNLVSLFELFSEDNHWFFTMELVKGDNFSRHVQRTAASQAGLDLDETLELGSTQDLTLEGPVSSPGVSVPGAPSGPRKARVDYGRLRRLTGSLVSGIGALHGAGKLHRDIKPTNILITAEERVVVLDFGLVQDFTQAELDQGGVLAGTIAYMSPEQAAAKPLTSKSDWYAVGVTLYFTLLGIVPFSGSPAEVLRLKQAGRPAAPRDLDPDIPQDLNDLCVSLLATDPAERPDQAKILAVLGEGAAELPAGGSRWDSVFVGRSTQLRALEEHLDAVRSGKGRQVFLRGPSGMGKSTLLAHFLESAKRQGALVLTGRCYEQESVPYKAVDSLIDALVHHIERLPLTEQIRLMPAALGSLQKVFPAFGQVVGNVVNSQQAGGVARLTTPSDAYETRRQAFGAMRTLLAGLAAGRPLVMAIDDLQWGDVDSANLLLEITRPPDPPALLLTGTYRSEYERRSEFLQVMFGTIEADRPDGRMVDVGPLDPDEARLLASYYSADRADSVVRESEGNPYFLQELARRQQAPGQSRSESITLDAALQERIMALDAGSRRLLQVVAVSGQPLLETEAWQASAQDPSNLGAWNQLRDGRFLRGSGAGARREVESYHDRIRETAAALLSAQERLAIHARLATVLEVGGRTDAERLGFHWERGGQPGRASALYCQGARQAVAKLAFQKAADLYERSYRLEPPAQQDLPAFQAEYAEALGNAGRARAAADLYQAAATGARPDQRFELQRRAAYFYCTAGHIEEGRAVLKGILASNGMRLPETPTQSILALLWARLRLKLRGLQFKPATADRVSENDLRRIDTAWTAALGLGVVDVVSGFSFTTRSLLLALNAGEPERIARSMIWEGATSAIEDIKRTRRLLSAAGPLVAASGQPYLRAMERMAEGLAGMNAGDWQAGYDLLRDAETLFSQATGAEWEISTCRTFHLTCAYYLGKFPELREGCNRVRREAEDRGNLYLETNLRCLADAFRLLADGQPEQARRGIRDVMSRWTQAGFHVQHSSAALSEGFCLIYEGCGRDAVESTTRSWGLAKKHHILRVNIYRVALMELRARAALTAAAQSESADRDLYLRQAEKLANDLTKEEFWAPVAITMIQAAAASLRGQPQAAIRLLQVAREKFGQLHMAAYRASAGWQIGALTTPDAPEARESAVWMRDNAIAEPAKFANLFAPGFVVIASQDRRNPTSCSFTSLPPSFTR